ncbi:MAG: hypothetical protein HRF49_05165 [bacterium]
MTKIINLRIVEEPAGIDLTGTPPEIINEQIPADAPVPVSRELAVDFRPLVSTPTSIMSAVAGRNPALGRAAVFRKHCSLMEAKVVSADAFGLPIRYRMVPWMHNPPEIRGKGASALLAASGCSPNEVEFVGTVTAPLECAERIEIAALSGKLLLFPKKGKPEMRRPVTAAVAMKKETREPLIAVLFK